MGKSDNKSLLSFLRRQESIRLVLNFEIIGWIPGQARNDKLNWFEECLTMDCL